MYKYCYYFENKMNISNLIEIIENYPDYNICVFDDDGIIIHTGRETVEIEHYHFDNMMFSFVNSEDYYRFLNDSLIYRTISTKDFIELIKPFKDASVIVSGEETGCIFIGDNKISFDYMESISSDEHLQEMLYKEGSQFVMVN